MLNMIRSYKNKWTAAIAGGTIKKGFPAHLVRKVQLMLTAMDAAVAVEDLRFPPGNRLEKLKGDREGQYSIRINDQWRICFIWTDAGPDQVEVVDYH